MKRSLGMLLPFWLVTACALGPADPQPPEAIDTERSAGTSLNGTSLNGTSLNGTSLNGTDLSGVLVSVDYANPRLRGIPFHELWIRDGILEGRIGEATMTGVELHGLHLQGNLGDGGTVLLRVRDIVQAAAPDDDLLLYYVEFLDEELGWQPACRDSYGTPTKALPLEGVWDHRQGVPEGGAKTADPERFTFACEAGALAKCVFLGYRPWATEQGKSLDGYHQTCTRVLRADYCGTGESQTVNGTLINLYDPLEIQDDTEDWVFEAQWDEGGARCFNPLNRTRADAPCYGLRVDNFCGLEQLFPDPSLRMTTETPTMGILE